MEQEQLGSQCIYSSDCLKFHNTDCINNKCRCSSNYIQLNSTYCAPKLGAYCAREACAAGNSVCIDYKCQCSPNFLKSHDRCLATNLNQSCSINADCDGIPFAECSTAKTCSCRLNYIQRGSNQCLSALGEACSEHSSCAAANSLCIDYKCQCKPRYASLSNSECVPLRINGVCRDNFDCQDVLNTICTDNKCQCDQDSFEVDGKCVALLGGFCSTNSDCITGNSCIDHICQCSHNYEPIGQNSCKPKSIGKACKLDEDCDFIKNAKCADNVCQCRDKYFGKSDFLCSPIIGGRCSHKSECFFNNLECIDGQCQCSEGLSAISSSQCLTTSLMFSCQHVSECADTSHFECLNNKCVCKADDNISLSGAMCLPLLGGICWKNDQCIPENSACIDFKCQCNPGYIAAAKNLCVKI
ncbi:prion-like-(Q/N-rich) domain-bearing protein 25 [Cotesia glomerata]|uniref:prion-like-(Q/N-rich) domain-bearing protein 25 n=1 Tax=Cotesia glomerata TaxID=32391 RepID=UPI001D0182D4|nr:prion-like-(Q/N-rich) domain-bearing protein 25 [Cotesia glomerata]